MRIVHWHSGFEREPLRQPFGFKGNYLTELWQIAVRVQDADGNEGIGTGLQSVLWSDAGLFNRLHECGGNALMLSLTHYALDQALNLEWETPLDLQEQLLPLVTAYARTATGSHAPRLTFILNALVPVDNAAWHLYARQYPALDFVGLIPPAFRQGLSHAHSRLSAVPLITYGTSRDEVQHLGQSGCPLFKIKIGSDPEADGDLDKMLHWDCQRLSELHAELKQYTCKDTHSGHVVYYLDANGRYDSIDRLSRFLDHADKIGALDRIVLFEEPFPEESILDVSALPVCIVADESAHSVEDAILRFSQGYRALALKPVAKTLSASLNMLAAATPLDVDCFCADLTVPPYVLEWNRNVAARLPPLPCMRCGLLESNGAQNYRNWESLVAAHPLPDATWIHPHQGAFELDETFYQKSGGLFEYPAYYDGLTRPII